jgi:hypothetical protein
MLVGHKPGRTYITQTQAYRSQAATVLVAQHFLFLFAFSAANEFFILFRQDFSSRSQAADVAPLKERHRSIASRESQACLRHEP